jgi:coatomer subunit beta
MSRCMVSISCWVCSSNIRAFFSPLTLLYRVDVLLVNQTPNTLQNLCLDFATLGDLKIVERPSVHTLAPHGFQSIKATIKVQNTTSLCRDESFMNAGFFDGNWCHLRQHSLGRQQHVRSLCHPQRYSCRYHGLHQACPLHRGTGTLYTITICDDRISMASSGACGRNLNGRTESTSIPRYRQLNHPCKLTTSSRVYSDPRDYLKHVMKATNMSCLTPEGATSGECDFLSANMYARSLFGKDLFSRSGKYLAQGSLRRGGCLSESKHREDGGRDDHRSCPYPQQNARNCSFAG